MDDHVARAVALFPAVRFHRACRPFRPWVPLRPRSRDLSVRLPFSLTLSLFFSTGPSLTPLSRRQPRDGLVPPFSNFSGRCTKPERDVENATEFSVGSRSRQQTRSLTTESIMAVVLNGGRVRRTGSAAHLGRRKRQQRARARHAGARETRDWRERERERDRAWREGISRERRRMAAAALRGGASGGRRERGRVDEWALLPRARESVRAIAIIDFPFFPTAGNASPARSPSGAEKWTAR